MANAGPDRIARGIALRIGSAGCFCIMSSLLKLASTRGVLGSELLFYRSIFAMPVVLIWVAIGPGWRALRTQRPWAHVGRCTLGVVTILVSFQALVMLPLAEAMTIGFTSPIWATILSWLLLRESVGWHRWAAVAVGFAGVAVIVRPGSSGQVLPLLGVGLTLLSALGSAGVTVALRQLRDTEQVAAIVFWFFVASTIVGGIILAFTGQMHDPATFAILAGAGLMGGFAQLAMTSSLQLAPVSVLAPFDYLQIVGGVLLGWLLLAAVPTLNTIAGAVLIASSGLYTAWREKRRRQVRPVPPTQPLA